MYPANSRVDRKSLVLRPSVLQAPRNSWDNRYCVAKLNVALCLDRYEIKSLELFVNSKTQTRLKNDDKMMMMIYYDPLEMQECDSQFRGG